MPLGQQFNPAKPTDSDFVRAATGPQLATVIRGLRASFKTFFSRLLDTETGDFNSDVIPWSSLKTLVPDPAGTYRTMNVNRKGQVIGGKADTSVQFPRVFRAVFFGEDGLESWVDSDAGPIPVSGEIVTSPWSGSSFSRFGYTTTPVTLTFREYLFTVPKGVRRVSCELTGGTPLIGAGSFTVSRKNTIQVSGGDVLRVYVGSDLISPCRVSTLDRVTFFDNTDVQTWSGLTYATRVYSTDGWFPRFGGTSGNPATVILEWYA